MNALAIDELVDRILLTWRGHEKMADVWAEVLRPLDRAQAIAAYEQLRAREETMPAIARFMTVYRALTPPPELHLERIDPDARAVEAARLRALYEGRRTLREKAAAFIAFGEGAEAS